MVGDISHVPVHAVAEAQGSMPSPNVEALNWFLTVMISPVATMVILRSFPNL